MAQLSGGTQVLSFYKIFGYPTGLGALVARRDALALLRPRYFGGGTAAACAVDEDFFRCACAVVGQLLFGEEALGKPCSVGRWHRGQPVRSMLALAGALCLVPL